MYPWSYFSNSSNGWLCRICKEYSETGDEKVSLVPLMKIIIKCFNKILMVTNIKKQSVRSILPIACFTKEAKKHKSQLAHKILRANSN